MTDPLDPRDPTDPRDLSDARDLSEAREQRRARLVTDANPAVALDYLVRLEAAGADFRLAVDYVPDKLILRPHALDDYVAGLGGDTLEALAVTILDDFNNEVVPRWVRIRIARGATHQTLLEDRQPKWDNPSLLGQLERF